MGTITEEQVLNELRTVDDPELGRNLVSLGMVKNILSEGSHVRVTTNRTVGSTAAQISIRNRLQSTARTSST